MIMYILLILALSTDTFIVALSYESNKIKIPFSSNLIISTICSTCLIISLLFGNIFNSIIPTNILKYFSFLILLFIGISKIFNNYLKKIIKKRIKFSLGHLNFIIEIYSDYKKADFNKSKNISKIEAIFLALALSIDNLSAGLVFQTKYSFFLLIFIFSTVTNLLSIYSSKIIKKINFDFSFIGGIIFIILAFLKIK